MKKHVLLIVLDGYGEGKDYKYNAVTRSDTPFLKSLRKNYPSTLLRADSEYVGLPPHTMGGSEVGHFTMGAGRIVYQSLEEINRSIKSGKFFRLKALKAAAENCRKNNSKFHILGMISDEGVHSHLDHLFTLLEFAKKEKLKKVYIHAITDGRDVPERSADKFIKKINSKIKQLGIGTLATIIGRYYAMDRDKNLDRTAKAYDLYASGKGKKESSALEAIKNEYAAGTDTDYYIKPILLDKEGLMEKDDSIVFFNYRTDRAKQITEAFTKKGFRHFVCFGPYSKTAPVLFSANKVKNNLGETLSKSHLSQLRIAETEKFAHVTFFFNSQIKEPYKGEKRMLVPSPKVPSYAQKPKMSAQRLASVLLEELNSNKKFDFILLNFANCDLVGHSGEFEAVKKGIEEIDKELKKIIPRALSKGYAVLLTADHGNAEFMKYPNGEDCPAHTLNPVIFIYISEENKVRSLRKGKNLGLKDVAPTVLKILRLKKPKEMTGSSLV
ncbi:MAG: 2,3-bisphosphoglycerate-independent phosphoglycerate mutase [Candidatus Peregrinibacteria bacterium]